ncbi:uncharacterized protein LOC120440473 [Oreochromis aureus]|uniref:uncharacterized protein LOC120440473 n=1 Tax=Oreochromis aureus TaxID=47969 RepID=UPI001953C51F|nr:uncharacterized protein LOC120440473 [Oreochromis aureus]
MSEEKNPTLTINDLRESDANTYCCMKTTDSPGHCWLNRISLQVVAELQVKVIPATEGQTVTLMCSSSCPLTEKPAAYIWYKNREFLYEDWSPWYQELLSSEEAVTYSCAVKGYEDLRAPEVSVASSVPIFVSWRPLNVGSKKWRKDKVEVDELIEAAGRVEYQDNMKKNDSGGYTFRFNKDHEGWTRSDLPGVFLIVTVMIFCFSIRIKVDVWPSAFSVSHHNFL